MSEYNDINPELEEQLDNVFSKYMQDEAKYQELVVKVFEKTIEDDPEVTRLLQTFKDFGATDLEAKIKLAEFMLASM